MIHTRGSERLSVNQIYDFIKKVEKDFPTPISAKTDLMEYAKKLYSNATLCTAEDNGKIVAMAAGYTENTVNNVAYITMVASLPEYRGKGLAKQLVTEFIDRAKSKRLKAVHL